MATRRLSLKQAVAKQRDWLMHYTNDMFLKAIKSTLYCHLRPPETRNMFNKRIIFRLRFF